MNWRKLELYPRDGELGWEFGRNQNHVLDLSISHQGTEIWRESTMNNQPTGDCQEKYIQRICWIPFRSYASVERDSSQGLHHSLLFHSPTTNQGRHLAPDSPVTIAGKTIKLVLAFFPLLTLHICAYVVCEWVIEVRQSATRRHESGTEFSESVKLHNKIFYIKTYTKLSISSWSGHSGQTT